jgi:hypothetical protein
LRLRQTLRDNGVGGWIERHANVRPGDFKVVFSVAGHAVAPIDNPIIPSVDRGLRHTFGKSSVQGVNKIAGAPTRVTVGQDALSVLLQNAQADRLSRVQDGFTCDRAAKGRSQGDHRGYVAWALVSHRTGDDAAQTVSDQVDLPASLSARPGDRLIQMTLDQEIWTIRIDPDSREIRTIADPAEPPMKLHQIEVGPGESGNNDDAGRVPVWNT